MTAPAEFYKLLDMNAAIVFSDRRSIRAIGKRWKMDIDDLVEEMVKAGPSAIRHIMDRDAEFKRRFELLCRRNERVVDPLEGF
jgi:hypothetical protein